MDYCYYELELKCSSCYSNDIITDNSTGDILCRSCGLIIGDRIINDEAEWKDYLNDDNNSNNNNGRSSMKGNDEEENKTILISTNNDDKEFLNRIQKISSKKEIKMYESYDNLQQLTFNLGLSDSITVSNNLYFLIITMMIMMII